MNKNAELIITEDGSHTIYLPNIEETYHSTHGSIQEAELVFIKNALMACEKEEINLLEIGFGTGLNAFLTLNYLMQNPKIERINYTSIELYPLSVDAALSLNYPEVILNSNRLLFEALHRSKWNESVEIIERFYLEKIEADFTSVELNEKYDVIYFDAFSPDKQSDMWNAELFEKIYIASNKDAIITTYSAKGSVRRALQNAGFVVERLPGPIGKREMLRGRKFVK